MFLRRISNLGILLAGTGVCAAILVCPNRAQQAPAASGARILILPRQVVSGERATLAVGVARGAPRPPPASSRSPATSSSPSHLSRGGVFAWSTAVSCRRLTAAASRRGRASGGIAPGRVGTWRRAGSTRRRSPARRRTASDRTSDRTREPCPSTNPLCVKTPISGGSGRDESTRHETAQLHRLVSGPGVTSPKSRPSGCNADHAATSRSLVSSRAAYPASRTSWR